MSKHRAGLHKEIKSIFEGVPIPQSNGTQQQTNTSAQYRPAYTPARPSVSSPQIPVMPKPVQPVQSPQPPLPKAAASKESVVETARKIAGKVPVLQIWQGLKNRFLGPKQGVSSAKHKVMVVLIPVLSVILIVVLAKVIGAPSSKAKASQKSGPSKTVVSSNKEIGWKIPESYPTTLRDPMQPSFSATAQAEADKLQGGTAGLVIKGIVYSEDKSSAIIGTQIVREGDKISGATIVKINKDSVEFEMNNQRWTQDVQR